MTETRDDHVLELLRMVANHISKHAGDKHGMWLVSQIHEVLRNSGQGKS